MDDRMGESEPKVEHLVASRVSSGSPVTGTGALCGQVKIYSQARRALSMEPAGSHHVGYIPLFSSPAWLLLFGSGTSSISMSVGFID
jgi:hypothetical protein